ncbi:islet cell autoantigen 1 isoform X1 [Pelobates cultripes]|uniref:Islet cell autoantigen 1 isoform X1 n=1 Tax=Pelobates cultripes TaxID=61616 RepID=A0AAD1T149_PELCU|nr:islet cell autoantigen 1 isoform X1 [Pelobates cultripes]
MKDVCQEFDPDIFKKIEKFRKVQAQVRHTKSAFDRLKTDVCEKVDLLRASRYNLLSHVLTTYQTTLLHFWEKTSHTIHESFKGEITTIKSLQFPSTVYNPEKKTKKKTKVKEYLAKNDDQLISLDDEMHHIETGMSSSEDELDKGILQSHSSYEGALDDLLDLKPEEKFLYEECASSKDLLDSDFGHKDDMQLLNKILSSSSLESGDLGKEWMDVFGEPMYPAQPLNPNTGETDKNAESSSGFLPSQLQDQDLNDLQSSFQDRTAGNVTSPTPQPTPPSSNPSTNINKLQMKESTKPAKDLSAWYNLFADLDPLSNPDAVGNTDQEHELLNA